MGMYGNQRIRGTGTFIQAIRYNIFPQESLFKCSIYCMQKTVDIPVLGGWISTVFCMQGLVTISTGEPLSTVSI